MGAHQGGASLLVGESRHTVQVREDCAYLGTRRANVVIVGATGTGKTFVASELQRCGGGGNLVRVNGARLGTGVAAGELFGYLRGAFTGAHQNHSGYVAQAAGGILFVDDGQDLSAEAQGHLLDIADGCPYRPLGGLRDERPDVRLVVATQRPLPALVRDGFRADLAHRLQGAAVALVPLRERLEDLDALVPHLAQRWAEKERLEPVPLSDAAQKRLRRHPWPGNVRELAHVLEVALLRAHRGRKRAVDASCVDAALHHSTAPHERGQVDRATLTVATVRAALEASDAVVSAAARRLGVSPRTLWRRMQELGIKPR